jgi:hypothetical protein
MIPSMLLGDKEIIKEIVEYIKNTGRFKLDQR